MSAARSFGVPGAEPIEPWVDCHVCGLAVQLDRAGLLGEHPGLGPDPAARCEASGAEPLWLDRVGTWRR